LYFTSLKPSRKAKRFRAMGHRNADAHDTVQSPLETGACSAVSAPLHLASGGYEHSSLANELS
jgi:hypothetical protein